MSRFGLVTAKSTSLLLITLVLFVTLLASCSGGTDQGDKGSNKEESTSASKNRNEGEGSKASSEEVAFTPDSENQNEGGGNGSNDRGSSPNYPDPPPHAPGYLPAHWPAGEGEGLYHPDVDGDGIGTGDWETFLIGKQPPGWVDYNGLHWDNCPATFNPNQEDSDSDGWGDFCDPEPLKPYDPTEQGRGKNP